jgi:rare lipoprotein A
LDDFFCQKIVKHNLTFLALATLILAFLILKFLSPDRATWYGESFRGKTMADGRPFNPDALTAACWDYPLGAKLKIVYHGRSVIVHVTDRGGKRRFLQLGKTVDLTRSAFAQLANPSAGSIHVRIVRIE